MHGNDLRVPSDHPSSVPPNVFPESSQQSGASSSVLSMQSLLRSDDPAIYQFGEPAANAVAGAAPTTSHGPTKPSESLLAQNIKVVVKGTLLALSYAAEGIPVPGTKGIFVAILKIIEVVEVNGMTLFD